MATLVKSNEEPNIWKVVDDNAVVDGTRPTKDEEMPPLGTVYFNGDFMFRPEIENGVEHTSGHLREIADLMDGLEKEQAATAGK